MQRIKQQIKTQATFLLACNTLQHMIKTEKIGKATAKQIFEALSMVTFRVNKFAPALAVFPLFEAVRAMNNTHFGNKWRQLIAWCDIVRNLSQNVQVVLPQDGRFGTQRARRVVPEDESDDDEEETSEREIVDYSKLFSYKGIVEYPYGTRVHVIYEKRSLILNKRKKRNFVFEVPQHAMQTINQANLSIRLCLTYDDSLCIPFGELGEVIASVNINQQLASVIDVDASDEVSMFDRYFGVDITKFCVVNSNQVELILGPENLNLNVQIVTVLRSSVPSIVQQVLENAILPQSKSLQMLQQIFEAEGDLAVTKNILSLKDTITQGRIAIPARGTDCEHFQCFDLNSFLQLNLETPKFTCPICSKQVLLASLVVDPIVTSILGKEKHLNEVDINKDGTIRKKRPAVEVISLDDEEEPKRKRKKRAK